MQAHAWINARLRTLITCVPYDISTVMFSLSLPYYTCVIMSLPWTLSSTYVDGGTTKGVECSSLVSALHKGRHEQDMCGGNVLPDLYSALIP